MHYVLLGAMEGWHGINEENHAHGLCLTKRMQKVLGSQWRFLATSPLQRLLLRIQ